MRNFEVRKARQGTQGQEPVPASPQGAAATSGVHTPHGLSRMALPSPPLRGGVGVGSAELSITPSVTT